MKPRRPPNARAAIDLTRHKISDRETCAALNAATGWVANTHEVEICLIRVLPCGGMGADGRIEAFEGHFADVLK